MKKQIPILTFLLMLPTALAQDIGKDVGQSLYKMFGFIFVDFSTKVGAPIFYFYIRFFLWIMLFAATFYGTRFVFKEQKRIQIAVSFVVAMLFVVMIPNNVILWIVKTYAIVSSFMLLAAPILGLIMFNHYILNKPGRAFYAAKAMIFYLLAMLIHNIAQVATIHYDIFAYEGNQWIGFAEGVCILLMLWNILRAMFPPGEEGKAPESFWDRLGKKEPEEVKKRKEEIEEAEEEKAEEEEAKKEKEEKKVDKMLKETRKKEKELENEIEKLMQSIDELNGALRERNKLGKKTLQERRELLKAILKWIEAIESAYNKLKDIDKDVEKGTVYNSKELQKQRSNLLRYIQDGLKKIGSLFEAVSKSILDEYSRILEKKKISDETLDKVKEAVKEYTELGKLEELDTKLERISKDIKNAIYRLEKRATAYMGEKMFTKGNLGRGGMEDVKERMRIYKENLRTIPVLLSKLKGIQKEISDLVKALREETGYIFKFELEDKKLIEDQRKKEKENKSSVDTIKDILKKLFIEPSSKLFKSLKDKIKDIYRNTEIEEEDVINEENYETKLEELKAKWDKLEERRKEADKIKKDIEDQLEAYKQPGSSTAGAATRSAQEAQGPNP